MNIGTKLEKLLKEKKTNVNQLSKRINVTPSTLYSIINRNNTKVEIDVLIAVANALDVPVEYFGDNYNYETKDYSFLKSDEKVLLEKYHNLNPQDKETIMNLITSLAEKAQSAQAEKEKMVETASAS